MASIVLSTIALALIVGSSTLSAQGAPVTAASESIERAEGLRDGASAGREVPTRDQYALGLFSGIVVGFAAALALSGQDLVHVIPAAAGVAAAVVGVTRNPRALDDSTRAVARRRGSVYEQAFLTGYANELRDSRRDAVLRGGAKGALVGVVLLVAGLSLFGGSS